MNGRRRLAGALTAALVLAIPAIGRADTVTVQALVSVGTRTMAVKAIGGGALSSLSLGNGAGTGFMVTVTDVAYQRNGYQVSANLSDLYAVSGSTFDCARKLPASSLTLGYLSNPTSLTGIGAVGQPVWNLSGSLTGLLATTLGVASGTAFSATGVNGNAVEKTLSGVFAGTEATLPMSLGEGGSGAFSAPAGHSTCAPSPAGSPTSKLVMSGGAQNQAGMLTWVQNAVVNGADQNLNGVVTGSELVGSGSIGSAELATAVRTALGNAGVNLGLLDTLLNAGTVSLADLFGVTTATLQPLTSVGGQSGTYIALPKLSASIPAGTASGTYRGTLTVTLVDL